MSVPKITKQLTDLEVKNLTRVGRHAVGGVVGLCKQVRSSSSASWILKASINGQQKELGLGSCRTVTLRDAREKARQLRLQIANGIDPIQQKRQAKLDHWRKKQRTKTFDEVAGLYIESKAAQWQNRKSRAQWESSLSTYVSPIIGTTDCAAIETADIMSVLDPIWLTKTETANRVRGRIEKILAYATTRGYRSGDNPARYRGHLDTLLPSPDKVKRTAAQPALDYRQLPTFMSALRGVDSVAARCLEFLILTATRQGEVRGLVWSELDVAQKLWVIPANRMKADREHVVPLTQRCLEIIKNMPRREDSPYVFASVRGGPLSDATVGKLVKTLHKAEVAKGGDGFVDPRQDKRAVVPHGFRSTFRDWAAERSSYPREVIEHCLAHRLKDRSEAAYQRGSILPKRIDLMTLYDQYCTALVTTIHTDNVRAIGDQRALNGG